MKSKAECQHPRRLIRCADSIADATNGNHYWECGECGQQFVERERLIKITKPEPRHDVRVPAPFGSRKP